jgi:hypothetical protein
MPEPRGVTWFRIDGLTARISHVYHVMYMYRHAWNLYIFNVQPHRAAQEGILGRHACGIMQEPHGMSVAWDDGLSASISRVYHVIYMYRHAWDLYIFNVQPHRAAQEGRLVQGAGLRCFLV